MHVLRTASQRKRTELHLSPLLTCMLHGVSDVLHCAQPGGPNENKEQNLVPTGAILLCMIKSSDIPEPSHRSNAPD